MSSRKAIAHLLLGHEKKLISLAEAWDGSIEQNLSRFPISSGERILLQVYDSLAREHGILGSLVCGLDDQNLSRVISAIRSIRPGVEV